MCFFAFKACTASYSTAIKSLILQVNLLQIQCSVVQNIHSTRVRIADIQIVEVFVPLSIHRIKKTLKKIQTTNSFQICKRNARRNEIICFFVPKWYCFEYIHEIPTWICGVGSPVAAQCNITDPISLTWIGPCGFIRNLGAITGVTTTVAVISPWSLTARHWYCPLSASVTFLNINVPFTSSTESGKLAAELWKKIYEREFVEHILAIDMFRFFLNFIVYGD